MCDQRTETDCVEVDGYRVTLRSTLFLSLLKELKAFEASILGSGKFYLQRMACHSVLTGGTCK